MRNELNVHSMLLFTSTSSTGFIIAQYVSSYAGYIVACVYSAHTTYISGSTIVSPFLPRPHSHSVFTTAMRAFAASSGVPLMSAEAGERPSESGER